LWTIRKAIGKATTSTRTGTIQWTAIVDYGILTVESGAIFQFRHAESQADLDEGRLETIQLHMSAHHIRECAEEMLSVADRLGV
jgi:hypothetical protein